VKHVFAGTRRPRRVGDPGQGGRHVTMTHSSYRVAAILHGRDRSGAAETPDGRFHKSIELCGRAACPTVRRAWERGRANRAALWTAGGPAGAWTRHTGPSWGIEREHPMEIEGTKFGTITIDGKTYETT
jgi:hypothetical protein